MASDRRMDLADWLGVILFVMLLVYGFASGTAFGQPAPNACQSSATCAMADAKISCVTSAASFPACTTARKGDIRCAGSLLYVCNGSGWVDIATSAAGYVLIAGSQMTGGLSTPQVDAGVLYVGGTNIAVPQPAIWLGEQRICLGRNDGGISCAPGIRTVQGAGIRFGVVESDGGIYNALSLLGNASGGNAGASAQFFDSAGGVNASVRDSTAVSGAGVYGHHLCPLDGGTCWTGQSVGDMKTTADNLMAFATSIQNTDSTASIGFRTGSTGINPSGNWTFQSVNRDTNGSTGDATTFLGADSSSRFVWTSLNTVGRWSAAGFVPLGVITADAGFAATVAPATSTCKTMAFAITTPSSGGGNAVAAVRDPTSGATIGTLTVPCAGLQGAVTTGACAGRPSSGDTVTLQWASEGCTADQEPGGNLNVIFSVP